MINPNRPPSAQRPWRRTALAAMLLAGTALGGFAIAQSGVAATDPSSSATPGAPVNPPGSGMSHALPDFTDLVTQVKPAVVSITSKMQAGPAADEDEPQTPRQFRQFPFGGMGPQMGPQSRAVEARGSGFIVDADGTIVTNNHVVKNAKTVSVTLDDGAVVPAKVIGRDSRTDIAVLKVDAHRQLPYIQLGNSASVKPGQWVVAMGNPFGLGGSVTAGIVSASGRDIGAGPYDHFIQIDAPINQGNSGGPLFTQDGKVIGMNTAILSPSGGSIGIGFAIPSDMIKTVVAQLEKTGHVTRGYIGVEAQPVSDTMAKAMHLSQNSGALIAGVQADAPAARAGLEPGDVITSVNGQAITNPRDLAMEIASVQPDGQAKLQVLRDGETKTVEVKVGQLPNEQMAGNDRAQESKGRIGVALAPLSPELSNQLNVPDGTRGVVVRSVEPGSPADQSGLEAGDVIVGIGGKKVTSPSDAASAIRTAAKDHAVALRIIRNGQAAFVAVNLDQSSEG
jgi:serine protease Do